LMAREEFEYEYDLGKLQIITPKKHDFSMLVTPRYIHEYCDNIYEDFTSDLLLTFSKNSKLFIDIGAHYGYYTILVGKKYPECKKIAFEPVPENFGILKRNVYLNKIQNVEQHNLAVSNIDGVSTFNITEASNSCGFYKHPLAETLKQMEINTVSLDKFLKINPEDSVLIKIDAEGHEPRILQGMKNFINNTKDLKMIIEFNPDCLANGGYDPSMFLQDVSDLGFDVYVIDDFKRLTYKLAKEGFQKWTEYLPKGDRNTYANILCIKKPKSLSVLLFSHSSYLNGAEKSLLELTRQLISNFHIICSVALPEEGPLKIRLDSIGASTLTIDYHWWCDVNTVSEDEKKNRLVDNFQNLANKLEELGKVNPDVIITNTLVIPWGATTAYLLGKPHIWFVHEFGESDHKLKFFLSLLTICRMIKDSSNIIVVNSNSVRNRLFGTNPDKNILTLYPPVSQNIFADVNTVFAEKESYFKNKLALKLIIYGLVSESKGQKDAILALNELSQRKQAVELIILGSANSKYLEELKRIVREYNLEAYVNFFDFRENPYPVVNQADVVLVCSRNEAFGLVAIEAMFLKKPLIGANTGGITEIIREGYNGLFYQPGDSMQLADRIEYFIEHKEKIAEFGQNGYELAKNNFVIEKYGNKLAELLWEVKEKENPSSKIFANFNRNIFMDTLIRLSNSIQANKAKIIELNTQMQLSNQANSSKIMELNAKTQLSKQADEAKINQLNAQIQNLQSGISMNLLRRYQKVVEKLLPMGSRRRNLYELNLSGFRVILNDGWKSFWKKFKNKIVNRSVSPKDPS
jgi:FkbM family methyltransferase